MPCCASSRAARSGKKEYKAVSDSEGGSDDEDYNVNSEFEVSPCPVSRLVLRMLLSAASRLGLAREARLCLAWFDLALLGVFGGLERFGKLSEAWRGFGSLG